MVNYYMETSTKKPNVFEASFGNNTALGRKERKESYVNDCDYCEGSGKDIFNRSDVCPFCYGSLKVVYNKNGEKIITI